MWLKRFFQNDVSEDAVKNLSRRQNSLLLLHLPSFLCALLPGFLSFWAPNTTASWALSLENRQRALVCKFSVSTHSTLSEFNTFRTVRCPILSTRLGLSSEIPGFPGPAFQTDYKPQESPRLRGCQKSREMWAASLPNCQHSNCWDRKLLLSFLGLNEYHLCLLWEKSSFLSRMKNSF